MKQMIKCLAAMCAIALGALAVVSCDKDDDDDDVIQEPVESNVQLSSLEINEGSTPSTIRFTYDSSDLLNYIKETTKYDDGDEYETVVDFSWNPFGISYNGKKIITSLTSQGYIASAYAQVYPSELTTFEYDNSGHLIKIVCDDKASNGYIYHSEKILTWKNGLLTGIVENWQEDQYTGIETWEISYGNIENKSGIWSAGFWESETLWFEPNNYDSPFMFHTGLLGVAPTKLPIKIMYSRDDRDPIRTEFTYILNEKGYISDERVMQSGSYPFTVNISYNYR